MPFLSFGGILSILIRCRVLTSLQQNVTIVQRASYFRCESGSFFSFFSVSEWPKAESPNEPSSLSYVNSWGRRAEAGPRCHCNGLVIDSQSEGERHDRRGNPRPVTPGTRYLCVFRVCEGMTGWMDLWHKLRWQGAGGGHGKFLEISGMKECWESGVMSRVEEVN